MTLLTTLVGGTTFKGAQGVQGIQGFQGRQGIQGISGQSFNQGIQGIQGSQGIQGVQGSQGIQGISGQSFNQGIQGIQGISGSFVAQGIQGPQGTQGIQGTQGLQGEQGIQGSQGRQGIQGISGQSFNQGIQGIQGISGSFVAQGIQGPQGIQGIQGPQGLQGEQGIQGTTGDIGPPGTGGISYVVKTSNYTAVTDEGILADTSGGAFTITLPSSPVAGDQVIIADAANSWGTNNLTVARNGSTIADLSEDLVFNINGVSVQLVYDGTTWVVYAQAIGFNGSAVVTLNDSQTLTNKTFDAGTVFTANSSANAVRITQTGAGNALVVEDSTNPDSTPFVVTADGRVIVGNTDGGYTGFGTASPIFGVVATVGGVGAGFSNWVNGAGGPTIQFLKSRGASPGTYAVVSSGDSLGQLRFGGDDGTTFIPAAVISANVDGTPGTNDMPGRLVFSTTADGASTPTERMRIRNDGNISIGGAGSALGKVTVAGTLVTSSSNSQTFRLAPTVPSTTTNGYWTVLSAPVTEAASFTLSNLYHFSVEPQTFGAGSSVTNQFGFIATSVLTGATNNYGFYSDIASGTGRWNFYANGTADNYFGGATTINVNSTSDALRITQTGSGNALIVEDETNPDSTPFVVMSDGNVGVGITNPSFKFMVSDGTINMAFAPLSGLGYFGTVTNHSLLFATNSIDRLQIDTAGLSTFTGSARVQAAATQDAVALAGRAGGTNSYASTITPSTLTANRTATLPDEDFEIGFRNIPQNSKSAAYTLVLSDAGKHILHPSADTTARTFTIPANSSVPYPIGTAITFINQNGAGVVTISITSDTMRLAGAGTTGNRTLAANGVATAIKITATEWIISGAGLT